MSQRQEETSRRHEQAGSRIAARRVVVGHARPVPPREWLMAFKLSPDALEHVMCRACLKTGEKQYLLSHRSGEAFRCISKGGGRHQWLRSMGMDAMCEFGHWTTVSPEGVVSCREGKRDQQDAG